MNFPAQDYTFPLPIKVGPATRWRLSDLEAYDAKAAGDTPPEPRTTDAERYLSAKKVAQRYDVSVATVWRWARRSAQVAAARREV